MPSHEPRRARKTFEIELPRDVAERIEERKENVHNNWNPV